MLFDLIDPLVPSSPDSVPLIAPLPQILQTFQRQVKQLEALIEKVELKAESPQSLVRRVRLRLNNAGLVSQKCPNTQMTLADIPESGEWLEYVENELKLRVASSRRLPHIGPMIIAEDANGLGVRLVCCSFGAEAAIPVCEGTRLTLRSFEVDRREASLPFLRALGPASIQVELVMDPSRTVEGWVSEGRRLQLANHYGLAYYSFQQAYCAPRREDNSCSGWRQVAAPGMALCALNLGNFYSVLELTEKANSVIPEDGRRALRADAYWRLRMYDQAMSELLESRDGDRLAAMRKLLSQPLEIENLMHLTLGGTLLPDRLENVTIEGHRVRSARDFKAGEVIFTESALCSASVLNGILEDNDENNDYEGPKLGPLWQFPESPALIKGISPKGDMAGPMPLEEAFQWAVFYNKPKYSGIREKIPVAEDSAILWTMVYQQCMTNILDQQDLRRYVDGYIAALEGEFGIFEVLSHVEPRCEHNSDVLFVGRHAIVRATKDISKGEYLTRYVGSTQAPGEWVCKQERDELNEARCYPPCDCGLCRYDMEFPDADGYEEVCRGLLKYYDTELSDLVRGENVQEVESIFEQYWSMADTLDETYTHQNRPGLGRCLLFRVLRGCLIAARDLDEEHRMKAARRITEIFESMKSDILQLPAYHSEVIEAYAALPDGKGVAAKLLHRYYGLGGEYYDLLYNSTS